MLELLVLLVLVFGGGGSTLLGLPLWQSACARHNSEVKLLSYPAVELLFEIPRLSAFGCTSIFSIASAYLSTAFRLLYLLLSVLGFDPEVPLGLVLLPACCTGFPGFTAGRGFDPAGGAPAFPFVPIVSAFPQQWLAQQSGRQRFRPRGHQFKKKGGSSSSGTGSSSSSGSKYGHFARVCPLAGSQKAATPPRGRGGPSKGHGFQQQQQQQRLGETPFRPFQQPGVSRFSSLVHHVSPAISGITDQLEDQLSKPARSKLILQMISY
ncbi:hypothetical protein F511_14311 [Dorcoceras hygrometricum]|uniref:Uncharacterized protein n=1 Tax=Dorcoceras hygrometricum TaxID=472368 RepID=A0A2Z7D1F4_9LAMI|nr:hypothetical protein F511_14311 [Dorcoceras hygrometricum]